MAIELPEQGAAPCWWSIREDALLDMLYRVHEGEDPDVVYAEAYANGYHKPVDPT